MRRLAGSPNILRLLEDWVDVERNEVLGQQGVMSCPLCSIACVCSMCLSPAWLISAQKILFTTPKIALS